MSPSEAFEYLDVRHPGDANATRIAARLFSRPADLPVKPGVMWLNGFKSVMTATKASALADWAVGGGRSFLRFDYGGHGESGGSFEDGTISRWLDEAAAVYGKFATGPQILVGSSMGGWISLLLNQLVRNVPSENDAVITGLVLIAPAVDMTKRLIWDKLPDELRVELEQTGKLSRPSQYDEEPYVFTKNLIDDGRSHLLLEKPAPIGCPVHILHGMQDPDVSWRHSVEVVEAFPDQNITLTLIKDGDHRLSRDQDIARLIRIIESMN